MRLSHSAMLICRFPATLTRACNEAFAGHNWRAILLPLISPEEYGSWRDSAPDQQALLSPAEELRLAAFPLAKRRNEWLTGRICAKLALAGFLQHSHGGTPATVPLSRIEIHNQPSGRPYFDSADFALPMVTDVSISHSQSYAIALVASGPCGIDIQGSNETLNRIIEKFCMPTELALLRHSLPERPKLHALTLLWAAKEATRKAFSSTRLAGFLELELASVLRQQESSCVFSLLLAQGQQEKPTLEFRVVVDLFGDYAIAACLDRRHTHA